ncbi:phosphatase PAP2 family protein [Acinetobacter sp. MD2]|uniref:phosphatase PAP2 family protein n=1 Tax=Acinetobacter sp. MD2 TaxID=2600066 RepID=UPI002D1EFD05|nr:phosphatase PAP2 family protein [Acinetobacter sp. MD2]MEB3766849.1 inositol phosphorylceramide synthase [Acinetobacter sp. MD2]
MNKRSYRLIHLLIGWGTVGFIYQFNSLLQAKATLLHPSKIDQLIPFTPYAIWPYLSFFIIIPVSFLSAPLHRVRWMAVCFMLTSLIAGSIYLFFPTSMLSAAPIGSSIHAQLLGALMSVDTENNCLPSLHVALTLIVVLGYINQKQKVKSILMALWGGVICLSVLFLKRHLFLDLVSGACLATVVGAGVYYGLKRMNYAAPLNRHGGR